jgi:spore photoproduct lyase
MTIQDNRKFVCQIESKLDSSLPIELGVNKKNELTRLVYEISRGQNLSLASILDRVKIERFLESGKGDLFDRVKKELLAIRYPSMRSGDDPRLMPIKIGENDEEYPAWDSELNPKTIYVEKDIESLQWTKEFAEQFPDAEVVNIKNIKDVSAEIMSGQDPAALYNTRRERVFLVRTKSTYIKICPCTKGYRRCGYWILNVGFGCPIDCSYCYLGMYSNAPGLILPANIEDYEEYVDQFDKETLKRTRIGTGEFTDSLALDRYTGYSSRLISYFRNTQNLVLELKTKSGDLDNVLREGPHENVVISWSMNPDEIAVGFEKGGVSTGQRIADAEKVAQKGYAIGFHFDPIIYYPGWEDSYKALVEDMFSRDVIRDNTTWVSLGTLRYSPGFKQTMEQRFADNRMFYSGEFFMDTDGKLRYPRFLRIDMYNKMIEWIKSHGVNCWIYLCMEPEEVWTKTMLEEDAYAYR